MKCYHKNPRQITKRQHADLRRWLRELGDLSGIVHDLNSDEIVGGNQRGEVFDINACQIEIAHATDEPDEQGTVAIGYIVWQEHRYNYRAVRWTEGQCEKANVIANKAGGDWDFDILANEFEFDDLLDWGFDKDRLLGAGIGLESVEFPEYDESIADEVKYMTCPKCGEMWPA